MKLSAFSIVKNEAQFIGYGLMSILPHVDQVVYADGNSTDGTLEILHHIKKKYAGGKLKILEMMDFKDFKDDYVRVFNELMEQCDGRYLWYCHPDMILREPGRIADIGKDGALAYYVNMRSFGGEDLDLEITKGRTDKWKTIMRNDFDLHYWGHYGHPHEDMYFKDITGDHHLVHRHMMDYPFEVKDLGMQIEHYCECKPRKRREEKMETVLRTVGGATNDIAIKDVLANHPRIHLQTQKTPWGDFEFKPRADALPDVFAKYKDEFSAVLGRAA